MELGIIGLGRMGGLMTERLLKGGHAVVGFDRSAEAVDRVKALVRNLSFGSTSRQICEQQDNMNGE